MALVKFNKRRTVGGFTFHAGWFGCFATSGELVKVYAYPWVEFDNWDDSMFVRDYRVFYKVGGEFIPDWESWDIAPEVVTEHFWKVAKRQEIERLESFYL